MYNMMNMGVNFCHVDSNRQFIHLIISIVAGYQK